MSPSADKKTSYANNVDAYIKHFNHTFESQMEEGLSSYNVADINTLNEETEIIKGGTSVISNRNDDFQVEINASEAVDETSIKSVNIFLFLKVRGNNKIQVKRTSSGQDNASAIKKISL